MGIETAIILGVAAAVSVAGTVSAAGAQVDAADDNTKILTQEQKRLNVVAQEQRSDRARAASQDFASMTVALSESGGADGQNAARFGGEINYLSGLDLARIEGNRRNQVEGAQREKDSVVASANAARDAAGFEIVSTVVGFAGQGAGFAAGEVDQASQVASATGSIPRQNPTPSPTGAR